MIVNTTIGSKAVMSPTAPHSRRQRPLLFTSVSLLCLCSPVTGWADDCNYNADPWTCTFSGGTPEQYVNLSAQSSSAGDPGVAMSITNNDFQDLTIGADGSAAAAWYMRSEGAPGNDNGSAGGGGWLTVYNTQEFISSVAASGYFTSLFYMGSQGGAGDQSNDNNNSSGGSGGNGGAITFTSDGIATYSTTGSSADGFAVFLGESFGGQGGKQNDSILSDQYGGPGGNGGTITINGGGLTDVDIGSSSDRFDGLDTGGGFIARSFGGGGGFNNGNAGAGGSISITGTAETRVYWNVNATGGTGLFGLAGFSKGGDGTTSSDNSDNGGLGGDAGSVTVTNDDSMLLDIAGNTPAISAAMAAKSAGGKGGTGPTKDHSGGNGGTSSTVSLGMNGFDAEIETHGDNVYGILGQSIGGEGGDGGDGAALAGTGGGGGFGGDAGNVDVTINDADEDNFISTTGNYAAGIAVHSIGGGGGTGGDFVSVLGGQAGNGGNGGNAGNVNVTSDLGIQTSGDHAFGIVAQSIAGSGGTGGIDSSIAVGLGGDGAGGGQTGTVTVNYDADITTHGFNALGIIAQSIGGGGGAAGSATGLVSVGGNAAGSTTSDGGTVGLSNGGTISTNGESSIAMLGHSIGGGGGSGGDSAGMAGVGGQGAAGGHGGAVTVSNLGRLQTAGDWSPGGVFQSIGGGGGNGGSVMTLSEFASIGIGGAASSGGNGGQICIDNTTSCGIDSSLDSIDSGADVSIATLGDFAPGLIAQSVGGGGGNGGSAKNYSVLSFFALQMGGSAGAGGAGSSVTLRQNDLGIATSGAQSTAVIAQSIGGGGGTGGSANYFDATIGFNAAFIVGGSGGTGGSGSAVTVDLRDATILTGATTSDPTPSAPNDAIGILAQSIGGGGGAGGATSAKDFLIAAPTGTGVPIAFNYQAAVGGNGGNAGDGSAVSVSLDRQSGLTTRGDGSHAIVAQSIGGGGGNGGDASVLSTTLGDKDTVEVTASVAFGGGAGNTLSDFNSDYAYTTSGGGNGNAVTVTLGTYGTDTNPSDPSVTRMTTTAPDNTLLTVSDSSYGVLAQSIGGGGGNGGVGNSNAYSQGGVASLKADISLGGQGGTGGAGGNVALHHFAGHTLQTQGSGARGLVAQSIGGGGGTSQGGTIYLAGSAGGFDGRLDVGIGGIGGSGGNGGTIYVEEYGRTQTFGGDADGIVVQSIGGGGGIGGSLGSDASSHKILDLIGNVEDQIGRVTDAGSSYELSVDVGGKGGSGGTGNTVKYYHQGQVTTFGDWADGVVLQSIGGGGGQGGSSVASGSDITANIEIGVGGKGGSGGDGGDVEIWLPASSSAFINTSGYGAFGLLMQSVGGGGGQGGDGSDSATGTMSIGGDGGGSGGAGGSGSTIENYDTSSVVITTSGSDASALVAQSIGGGGGAGGVGSSAEATRADGHELSISVGGKGGVAGDGGAINLALNTSIVTSGDRAHGTLLQSIGGGGGLGVTGAVGSDLDLAIGGSGGAAGDGGNITYNLTGGNGISTQGAGSHGLIIQSIGGGGGLGGDATGGILSLNPDSEPTSGGASGNGGLVSMDIYSPITVTGADAIGLLAQSIGGGGGFGGSGDGAFAGVTSSDGEGTAGNIDLTVRSDVFSSGTRGIGIFAQSQGPSGNGKVDIELVQGAVVHGGFSDDSASIQVAGGLGNTVTLSDDAYLSSGASYSGQSFDRSYAVLFNGIGTTADGSTLDLVVNDTASLYGDVLLSNADGDSAGTISNNSSNTLADGHFYGANIVNNGRFVLGRSGETRTTSVTGNFVQTGNGRTVVDIDMNTLKSDLLELRGNGSLAGTLGVNALSLLPDRTVRFMTGAGTLTGAFKPQHSAIFDYSIREIGSDRFLSINSADFTPTAIRNLNSDQTALAQNLQSIWNTGGNNVFGSLFGAIANEVDNGAGDYASVLDELRPQTAFAPVVEQSFEMLEFGNSVMSCPVIEENGVKLTKGSCGWSRLTAGTGNRTSIGGSPSYQADAVTYAMGAQKEIIPGWFLGGSAAYQQSWLSQSSGSVSGEGHGGFAGVSLSHEVNDWTFAGAVSGSYANFDINRRISIPGVSETVSGSPDVLAGSVRARIARTFAAANTYVKPFVDLDALYTWTGDYKESGAYGLQYDSAGQWTFAASPTIEIGSRYVYDGGTSLRVFGRLGATILSNDDWETSARFTSAPAGTGQFKTSLDHDDLFATIGAGLQLTSINGVDLRLEYDGHFSDKIATNSGSLRLSIPF